MPFYDHKCDRCEVQFESTERVPPSCPECGRSDMVMRLFTNAGVIYKTDGFYSTDHREEPD